MLQLILWHYCILSFLKVYLIDLFHLHLKFLTMFLHSINWYKFTLYLTFDSWYLSRPLLSLRNDSLIFWKMACKRIAVMSWAEVGRFAGKVIRGKIQKKLLGFTLSFPWTIKLYSNFFGEGHLFSLILLPVMEYRIR